MRCGARLTLLELMQDGCPNCGLPGSVIADSPVDEQGLVADDAACRGCGYNLRGLHSSGNCPECGTQVYLSVLGNRLRFCDPAWLQRLAYSAVGVGVILAVYAAAWAFITSGMALRGMPRFLACGGYYILAAVGMYYAWRLTSPEPHKDRLQNANRRRISVFAWLALSVLAVPFLLLPLLPGGGNVPAVFVAMVASGLRVVGPVRYLRLLADLVERLPDQVMTQRLTALTWYWVLTLVPWSLAEMAVVYGGNSDYTLLSLVPCCVPAWVIVAIVTLVFTAVFHASLATRIVEQGRIAEQTWSGARWGPDSHSE